MAKKQKMEEIKMGAPEWMATFSDLMTLLLCFFVLLFASSSQDAAKFAAIANSFDGAPGIMVDGDIMLNEHGMVGSGLEEYPDPPAIIEALADILEDDAKSIKDEIQEYIYEEGLDSKVEVEQFGDEIVITFEDFLLFDTGKADIKPAGIPILDTMGIKIREYTLDGYNIRLEGHTDNVPIRTAQFPSNWELSSARAIAVGKFFIDQLEFTPDTVSAEGFGEYKPIADNNTAEGRSINRRVEVKIIKSLF
ncbi:hypothetical protein AN639_09030 [Candidatus Epulonipiscium fishelsonii]|uniref:Uncharacterized protein n=1 Tax=Candidatus Epulonipiscium fishelsonii TaxID=77094 RepID=A0ACC8XDQ5_9FIRM|nr:hypothetical protein AN639_09030 [Epulopiscium sp. SCG-B05WGA-EpuloA1]ONI40989.1 hypothetical protein AN396_04315 [Epulopiscium sp. SCG-B11WGA-EpuloA1]ONI47341.1 hypothetical protein AN644_00760 [Epulopiscium sp. SCG-C06WGA-EpuloA1]